METVGNTSALVFKRSRKWYGFSYHILLGIFLNFVLTSNQANNIRFQLRGRVLSALCHPSAPVPLPPDSLGPISVLGNSTALLCSYRRVGTAKALKYEDGSASSVSQTGEAIWDNACWPGNHPMFPGSDQQGVTLPNMLVKARNVYSKTKALLSALAWKIVLDFIAA